LIEISAKAGHPLRIKAPESGLLLSGLKIPDYLLKSGKNKSYKPEKQG